MERRPTAGIEPRKRTSVTTIKRTCPTPRPASKGVEADARAHYHRAHTEIDHVLECTAGAAGGLDGERVAVGLGSTILIPPGYSTGQWGG
jgi:hypothetical protein